MDPCELEFSDPFQDDGLLAPSGTYHADRSDIRSSCEDEPHRSLHANPSPFQGHLQASGASERSDIPAETCLAVESFDDCVVGRLLGLLKSNVTLFTS